MSKPRIAVVGVGVAGLTAAWKLQHRADLTLFEKNAYIGGHTRTLTVPDGPDAGTQVDTGFIVMNHRNYPCFTALLREWEVELEDSDMSFSYHDAQTGYAYAGTGLRGIFPSPARLFDRDHWTLLRELRRFGKAGARALADGSAARQSLGDFLEAHRFSPIFRDRYLFAMGAAIWSSPPERLADFPAEPYLHFFDNHGLLSLRDRPQWRVVRGGSQTYVRKALASLKAEVRPGDPPEKIFRDSEGVSLRFSDGRNLRFDQVILGCHADEALALLGDADPEERRLLGNCRYQPNRVVLHRWEGVMPRPRACWASWNFAREPGKADSEPVSVSYWMNRLQNLKTRHQYFVTLNRGGDIPAEAVLDECVLHHPQFDRAALDSQTELRSRNGANRCWFVGGYLGYGFHEDAVRSAEEAVAALESRL